MPVTKKKKTLRRKKSKRGSSKTRTRSWKPRVPPKGSTSNERQLAWEARMSPKVYQKDGDPSTYAPDKLRLRRRLRFNPQIKELVLNTWWAMLVKTPLLVNATLIEVLPPREYLYLNALMYRALVPEATMDEAKESAREDYRTDTEKLPLDLARLGIPRGVFYDSLFTLVDMWTETCNVAEYVHFLKVLFHRILPKLKQRKQALAIQGIPQIKAITVNLWEHLEQGTEVPKTAEDYTNFEHLLPETISLQDLPQELQKPSITFVKGDSALLNGQVPDSSAHHSEQPSDMDQQDVEKRDPALMELHRSSQGSLHDLQQQYNRLVEQQSLDMGPELTAEEQAELDRQGLVTTNGNNQYDSDEELNEVEQALFPPTNRLISSMVGLSRSVSKANSEVSYSESQIPLSVMDHSSQASPQTDSKHKAASQIDHKSNAPATVPPIHSAQMEASGKVMAAATLPNFELLKSPHSTVDLTQRSEASDDEKFGQGLEVYAEEEDPYKTDSVDEDLDESYLYPMSDRHSANANTQQSARRRTLDGSRTSRASYRPGSAASGVRPLSGKSRGSKSTRSIKTRFIGMKNTPVEMIESEDMIEKRVPGWKSIYFFTDDHPTADGCLLITVQSLQSEAVEFDLMVHQGTLPTRGQCTWSSENKDGHLIIIEGGSPLLRPDQTVYIGIANKNSNEKICRVLVRHLEFSDELVPGFPGSPVHIYEKTASPLDPYFFMLRFPTLPEKERRPSSILEESVISQHSGPKKRAIKGSEAHVTVKAKDTDQKMAIFACTTHKYPAPGGRHHTWKATCGGRSQSDSTEGRKDGHSSVTRPPSKMKPLSATLAAPVPSNRDTWLYFSVFILRNSRSSKKKNVDKIVELEIKTDFIQLPYVLREGNLQQVSIPRFHSFFFQIQLKDTEIKELYCRTNVDTVHDGDMPGIPTEENDCSWLNPYPHHFFSRMCRFPFFGTAEDVKALVKTEDMEFSVKPEEIMFGSKIYYGTVYAGNADVDFNIGYWVKSMSYAEGLADYPMLPMQSEFSKINVDAEDDQSGLGRSRHTTELTWSRTNSPQGSKKSFHNTVYYQVTNDVVQPNFNPFSDDRSIGDGSRSLDGRRSVGSHSSRRRRPVSAQGNYGTPIVRVAARPARSWSASGRLSKELPMGKAEFLDTPDHHYNFPTAASESTREERPVSASRRLSSGDPRGILRSGHRRNAVTTTPAENERYLIYPAAEKTPPGPRPASASRAAKVQMQASRLGQQRRPASAFAKTYAYDHSPRYEDLLPYEQQPRTASSPLDGAIRRKHRGMQLPWSRINNPYRYSLPFDSPVISRKAMEDNSLIASEPDPKLTGLDVRRKTAVSAERINVF